MSLGNPSTKLLAYIQQVKERTGRSVVIRPYDDATESDSPAASLELGPDIVTIDIRLRPIRPLNDANTERQVAHELTHALMIYSEGYEIPCAPSNVSEYDVQTIAEIVDLVDDVIVDVRIHNIGFIIPSSDQLANLQERLIVIESATSRAQIDPFEEDPIRAEIKLVSLYIYAWAIPRYAKISQEASALYTRFVRRFPQIMKFEFEKATKIKKLTLANDIFSLQGRTNVIVGAADLWPYNNDVYLSPISTA